MELRGLLQVSHKNEPNTSKSSGVIELRDVIRFNMIKSETYISLNWRYNKKEKKKKKDYKLEQEKAGMELKEWPSLYLLAKDDILTLKIPIDRSNSQYKKDKSQYSWG